ncbi:MAG: carbohydrate kinase [Myxococcota bacterium]|nr:carbohydrate kinase [Myxococcota bacterium]
MLVSLGEYLVDLFVKPSLDAVTDEITGLIGGSPLNIAIAAARSGSTSGFMCPISSDSFGQRALSILAEESVSQLIAPCVAAPTAMAVIELNAEGQPRYTFHRGRTADRALSAAQLVEAIPSDCRFLQFGSLCLAQDADWASWRAVVQEARRRGATIGLDPNVRTGLIDDPNDHRARFSQALGLCNILKLSDEDFELLAPDQSPAQTIPSWMQQHQIDLAILTSGSKPTHAWLKSGLHLQMQPPQIGEIKDTVGAGDTFQGAAMSWLSDAAIHPSKLTEETLARLLQFAHAAAALNCQRSGCNPPTKAEIIDFLKRYPSR